ncbi:MAG: hypothetical protein U9R36_02600 [Elusimicrobiota bacterium]|nr:hypothetical protein [Elusimicrobiota bacterium]
MDILNTYTIALKITLLITAGFIINRVFYRRRAVRKVIKYIIDILWYILIPLFVVFSIWSVDLTGISAVYLMLAAAFAVASGIFIAVLLSRKIGIELRTIALPIIFMNSGYLGISLNKLLFNGQVAAMAAIYNVANAFLIFTAGIFIAAKKTAIKNIIKVPVVYAVFAGFLLNFSGAKPGLPGAGELVKAVPYMMLIYVGYSLKGVGRKNMKFIFIGALGRILGGLAAGIIFVLLFRPSAAVSGVILLSSALPSALNTIIISKKYNVDTSLTGGIITLSTLLFMAVLPFIVKLIYYIR